MNYECKGKKLKINENILTINKNILKFRNKNDNFCAKFLFFYKKK